VAWLGLSPKVEASGGKARTGRITKAGDGYLRRLLVHGARSLVHWRLKGKAGGRSAWLEALLKRRPKAVAIVAVAAKLARMAWAMLVSGESYRRLAAAAA
jgi:transposase